MKQFHVLERLSFIKIATLWISTIILFSVIFAINAPPTEAVYLSFITALTIGYGEPITNTTRALVIIEAIISLVLFATFISKIVSIKQEEIIDEVKELSFEEATQNAITDLYLFRNDLKQKNIPEAKNHLETALTRYTNLKFIHNEKSLMNISLITNSLNISLSMLCEILESKRKTNWTKESTTSTADNAGKILKTLYEEYNTIKSGQHDTVVEEKLEDLSKTIAALKSFEAT
jgi:hypothetical protein